MGAAVPGLIMGHFQATALWLPLAHLTLAKCARTFKPQSTLPVQHRTLMRIPPSITVFGKVRLYQRDYTMVQQRIPKAKWRYLRLKLWLIATTC